MSDVRKRTAVHDRRRVFKRLNEVRLECVFQQSDHSAAAAELFCIDSVAVKVVADEHPFKPCLEVVKVARKAQDSHYLRSDGYLEAVLSGEAVYLAAQADDDLTQSTVVHIHTSFEKDTSFVETKRIALVDRVVYQRTKQVVSRRDSVHIACEMQVDVLHWNDLCISAACGTALDAENGSERRLTQSKDSVLSYLRHRLGKTYGNSGLSLAGGCGVDSGYKYQLAVGLVLGLFVKALGELSLVVTVRLKVLLGDAQVLGYLAYFQHFRLLSDLDI